MNRSEVSNLVALPAMKMAALAATDAPKRFKLFNWGENPSTKGKFIVNETTLASLPANQRTLGFDRVALDFEHNTVPGSPEFERTREPRAIGGFGNIEVVNGDGLYLANIDWRDADSRKNFEDLSPTVGTNSSGEVTFVHSVALCRNGSVFNLTIDNATALSAILPNNKPTNNSMQLTLAWLAVALSLPETATEAEVKQKLTGLVSLSGALQFKDGKIVPLTAALPTDVENRLKTVEGFMSGISGKETDDLVIALSAGGQLPINPANGNAYTLDELKKLDLPTLRLLKANSPHLVPLSAHARRAGEYGAGTGNIDKVVALNAAVADYQAQHPGASTEAAFSALRASKPQLFA